MKTIPYNEENIRKFKSPENLLRHARTGKGISGVMYVLGQDLIGYIGWEGKMIIALEVTEKYRGKGYGEKLLREAIEAGCEFLTVSPKNTIAQNLYRKIGFIQVSERLWKLNTKRYMITFKQKEYTKAEQEGLDWWARRSLKKEKKKILKDLKAARKANSKIMTGDALLTANTAGADQISQKVKGITEKLRNQSATRAKWGKRAGIAGLATAGSLGAYKLYKHVQESNENGY